MTMNRYNHIEIVTIHLCYSSWLLKQWSVYQIDSITFCLGKRCIVRHPTFFLFIRDTASRLYHSVITFVYRLFLFLYQINSVLLVKNWQSFYGVPWSIFSACYRWRRCGFVRMFVPICSDDSLFLCHVQHVRSASGNVGGHCLHGQPHAVKMMRDAHLSSSSSSSSVGRNLTMTTTTPGEWQRNLSDEAIEQTRSPCADNLVAGNNRSVFVVIIRMIDWLSSVLRLCQHSIGFMGDGFYRSKDPTNSIKVLKEKKYEPYAYGTGRVYGS